MTTPSDEARIDEAIIRAIRKWTADSGLSPLATFIRSEGITLTIEPEPEPVYVLRAPLSQFGYVFAALDRHESIVGDEPEFQALMDTVRALTPEER